MHVQVLGTFITEWAEGSLLCELLLNTEQSCEEAAMQLTKIASYYGFDGWLLNIENPVLLRLIPNLLHFIRWDIVPVPCSHSWTEPPCGILRPA